jgi:hypothetical protein
MKIIIAIMLGMFFAVASYSEDTPDTRIPFVEPDWAREEPKTSEEIISKDCKICCFSYLKFEAEEYMADQEEYKKMFGEYKDSNSKIWDIKKEHLPYYTAIYKTLADKYKKKTGRAFKPLPAHDAVCKGLQLVVCDQYRVGEYHISPQERK